MLLRKVLAFLYCVLFLSGCKQAESFSLAGYSYGEFIYLSFPFDTKIEQLLVSKGETVKKGQPLIKAADFPQENALRQAEGRIAAEKALLRNLQTGERMAALAVIQAQLDRAASAARLASRQLTRKKQLYQQKMISTAEWEKIKSEYAQKKAQVTELSHQLELKKLPARQDEINQQKSQLEAAMLQRNKAHWDLQQTILMASQNAIVYDILYHPGEHSAAGKPVITLLPPDNIKIRFYIPEKRLSEIQAGSKVKIYYNGNSRPISGYINYISPQAEFSPPVIYSTQRREKLLFMVEAIPLKDTSPLIKPGQPVNVEIIRNE